ncbi:ATP-binding cassette domain-containing protein [Arthrobacter alpinus]|nr:ATP-binding cassette domain-containing protein [Arthrobacter alpinus]
MQATSDAPAHLQVSDVHKSFGGTDVLKGVDLDVMQGRTTAIVGPSGSGKTTLLRLIAGFSAPDSGRIALGGKEVAGPSQWNPAHKRSVGYVAQDGALFPHLNVGANIAFGLPLRGKAASLRVGSCWKWSRWTPPMPSAARTSYPVGSSNVWPWHGRWPASRN